MTDRRTFLLQGSSISAATALLPTPGAQAQTFGHSGSGRRRHRIALLVANGEYPEGGELPPARKNAQDLEAALRGLDFEVETVVDADHGAFQAALESFQRKLAQATENDEAIALFYFFGHGFQLEHRNYLLSAKANPYPREANEMLEKAVSLQQQVFRMFPKQYPGLSIAVIDACRFGLPQPEKDKGSDEGLNQEPPPRGCLVMFATDKNRPAIAPNDPNQNSFFTASLTKYLASASAVTPLYDIFRAVREDVIRTMKSHPIAAIRRAAQEPFIAADFETTEFLLRPLPATASMAAQGASAGPAPAASPAQATPSASSVPPAQPASPAGSVPTAQAASAAAAAPVPPEPELFSQLAEAVLPEAVIESADRFLAAYPDSDRVLSAEVARSGAQASRDAFGDRQVRLRRSGVDISIGNERYKADVRLAMRGDKDAASRIGERYREGSDGIAQNLRRYEAWMQFAAALGNGIASWELYQRYAREGRDEPAARYRKLAIDLGYQAPRELTQRRY